MTAGGAAVVLAGLAGALIAPAGGVGAARLIRAFAPPSSAACPTGAPRSPNWVIRAAVAGAVVAAASGAGAVAVILGVLALVTARSGSRHRQAERAARAATAHDLPRAADLLASALSAGAAPAAALAAVAEAVGGEVGARLRSVAAGLAGGWDPPEPPQGDPTARLVRSLVRASATGAPLADAVRAIAEEERQRARWEAMERARTAGVRAVGPLAACFLPAFVLVGVVPVVAGIARALLADFA